MPIPRPGAVRPWSSAPSAQRFRRPTDFLLAIGSLLALTAMLPAAAADGPLDQAVSHLAAATIGALGWLWALGYAALVLWAAALVVLPVISRGRRATLLVQLLAAAIAVGLGLVANRVVTGGWQVPASGSDSGLFGHVVLPAVATALVVATSPYLAHPLRLVGRLAVIAAAASAVGMGSATLTFTLCALAIAVLAAATSHLVLGTPAGRPTAAHVADALAGLGIAVDQVTEATVQQPGVCVMDARAADGRGLLVKVYGRDAWDGQVVGSMWTALTRKGESPVILRSRTERVEHEAMVTLLAQRASVPVVAAVVAGRTDEGDALLVTEARGPSLDRGALGGDEGSCDRFLASAWRALLALHDAGIAHRDLTADRVVAQSDGCAALCDFDVAEVAAGRSSFLADRARLLALTAVAAGREQALDAALEALGEQALAELLPYLQPAVMDATTGEDLEAKEWTLVELREAAAARAGVDVPPLIQLRRVTVKSIAVAALIVLMAYTLIGVFAGVDLATILGELKSADMALMALALVLSPTIGAALALSTLGASPEPLRYRAVVMLEYAIQFIALTLPATAARLALEIRFFQRFGLSAGAAVSVGLIDSLSGFALQIVLIALILLSGLPTFTTSLASSTSGTGTTDDSGPGLIAVLLVIVVVSILVTLIVPRLRHRLLAQVPRAKEAIRENADSAKSVLAVLRRPRKVAQMIGGNLVSQVIQAVILGICLAAFGETAYLSQLILINTAVSLLGGLMPVPGNMGVAEAGYTLGLQAIGVPTAIAMSTAIAFRLVTFYLPPLWGAFAMRWLHRKAYV
ncbi:MAG: lysylphosphatidylglycerol synthase transmembrane domain-containing protein [Actinomycetota bacterium]|nr:lysylphosphatidylglycerol synthase transmembrane domain-containing protein [Actinomycetota bacterium]